MIVPDSGSPAQRSAIRKHSTGKERDAETGLDYFGARYMSAAQGRFTSSDPGAYKSEDPQTFNRYSYVNNNPLKFIDPFGREATWVIDSTAKTLKFNCTITIWGPGANAQYATFLKNEIEDAWKGTYVNPKTGRRFTVTTEVEVSVYGSSGAGQTAQNGFYVSNDVGISNFNYYFVDPHWKKRYENDPGIYTGAINPQKHDERHEAGHVLGLPDDYEGYFEGLNIKYRPKPGHRGHLMAGANVKYAAQDEINRLGNYVFGQSAATHKWTGTIIRLPEPPKPTP
jgi:RHS repeat-associated protein